MRWGSPCLQPLLGGGVGISPSSLERWKDAVAREGLEAMGSRALRGAVPSLGAGYWWAQGIPPWGHAEGCWGEEGCCATHLCWGEVTVLGDMRLLGLSRCAERLEQGAIGVSIALVLMGVYVHVHRKTSEALDVTLGLQARWIL